MRESVIEKHLKKRVEQAGGLCYKWVSPGNTGVPDRIVFLHNAVFFVELKALNGKLSAAQHRQRFKLMALGQYVITLNSKELVDSWVTMQSMVLATDFPK